MMAGSIEEGSGAAPPPIRKAAAGRAWSYNGDAPFLPATTSRVHLTDGRPYSRTGRNVVALCGATVWPDAIPEGHPAPVCAPCRRALAERA